MGKGSYNYAVQKLSEVLSCLATHPGDARTRIVAVYPVLSRLTESDLPPNVHQKWRWIIAEATRYGPVRTSKGEILYEAVQNTMKNRRNVTAAKLAKALYEIYWEVSRNEPYL